MLFSIIFTTTFLTVNHIYATFASPMPYKGDVAASQSLNLTHSLASLAKRAFLPPDTLCRPTKGWIDRECSDIVDDRTWLDSCIRTVYLEPEVYLTAGSCPIGTMCVNKMSPSGFLPGQGPSLVRNIECIGRPSIFNNFSPGVQIGVQAVNNHGATGNYPTVRVPIARGILKASVSALLEGKSSH
jgi:hypothetical protein